MDDSRVDNFQWTTLNRAPPTTKKNKKIEASQTRPGLNQSPSPLYPPMLRTSISTGSSENSTPTAIAAENDEVDIVGGGLQPISPSIQDIQVFIGLPNFYQRLTQVFSKLVTDLSLILKTTGSSEMPAPRAIRASDDEVVGGGGGQESILSSRIEGEPSRTGLIEDFSITAPLTPMLKTTGSFEVLAPRAFGADDNEDCWGWWWCN